MKAEHTEPLGLDPGAVAAMAAAVPALHRWYEAHARDLPWRRTRDPYAIWVSEVMLQQTRVSTVLPYYERWMARFPDVPTLARADGHDVLVAWEGLGYYRRANMLHRAARKVVEHHGGEIPSDPERFGALPGVGPYTRAAVTSLAFGADLAAVDGNVRRVLGRLAALETDPARGAAGRALERLAQHLLPPGTARVHNQTVMELGALVCAPKAPGCPSCPLAEACGARASGTPEKYPGRRPRAPVPHHRVAVGIVHHRGRIFIDRRPYGGLLGGLWEFPGGKVEADETPEDTLHRELFEEFGLRVQVVRALPTVDHAYTHLRVTLHPFECRLTDRDGRVGEGNEWRWVRPAELSDYPMPRANRKVLERMGQRARSRAPTPRVPYP